ncbi:hypothetical protein DICPUDRAFT_95570 [Dictyostelium purpureum]|uniref:non-specific serine/threonine protein kinase n=1 Tax=Dictyostelium purpureum TaxID=5786 RepID=F0ZY14_DICPU|nr:uncharacterized protein DICPUDRAFT_95570 [Dictyostelium purpureum]EGC31160.1 hypothetical protein DICPUDRAFT_95570 [Dictyostelium purpureum]|eukprot:XP_003292307.1 hypothetical protein DICPUDRAFT_95570 [Dictyostelium purpureum]
MTTTQTFSQELIVAIEQNDINKVRKLHSKKRITRQNIVAFDGFGQSPITAAVKNNNEEILDLLLQLCITLKADINNRDKNGFTALHQAVYYEDKILMKLLQYDNINVDVQNEDYNTPIHYFCQKFKYPSCQEPFQLFIQKGVNVNAQNKNGETPLHKAIFNNYVRLILVNLLLKNGANVNLVTMNQESPLHYAVRLGREDLVSVLLKAGADVDFVGTKDKKTPYELAIDEGSKEMIARIKKYKVLFQWLQEHDLEQYKDAFLKEEIFYDEISEMNEAMVDKMGFSKGHRLRIIKLITNLANENKEKKPKTPEVIAEEDPSPPDTPDISGLRHSLHTLRHIGEVNIIKHEELEYTDKLGSGSSGKVYKGLYKGKEVAIKVLKSMTEAREIDEFKKEFQIMSAIRSKHVVHFYGAVLQPKLCMVMENCIRGSLYHVMNDEKLDIGWDKTFRFATEAARGIACLHMWEPMIVHRDLKSLNLLVNDKWEVKVCDFGLSRFNTGSNLETLVKMRGTFAYCAPEVYFGEQFSARSDVYSMGMILWELVTRCINGRYERPFSEFKNLQHDFQIIIQTAKRNLRPTIPKACPVSFSQLIQDCWDPSSENRPTCSDIVRRLAEIENEYRMNTQLWNSYIVPLPKSQDN